MDLIGKTVFKSILFIPDLPENRENSRPKSGRPEGLERLKFQQDKAFQANRNSGVGYTSFRTVVWLLRGYRS